MPMLARLSACIRPSHPTSSDAWLSALLTCTRYTLSFHTAPRADKTTSCTVRQKEREKRENWAAAAHCHPIHSSFVQPQLACRLLFSLHWPDDSSLELAISRTTPQFQLAFINKPFGIPIHVRPLFWTPHFTHTLSLITFPASSYGTCTFFFSCSGCAFEKFLSLPRTVSERLAALLPPHSTAHEKGKKKEKEKH